MVLMVRVHGFYRRAIVPGTHEPVSSSVSSFFNSTLKGLRSQCSIQLPSISIHSFMYHTVSISILSICIVVVVVHLLSITEYSPGMFDMSFLIFMIRIPYFYRQRQYISISIVQYYSSYYRQPRVLNTIHSILDFSVTIPWYDTRVSEYYIVLDHVFASTRVVEYHGNLL